MSSSASLRQRLLSDSDDNKNDGTKREEISQQKQQPYRCNNDKEVLVQDIDIVERQKHKRLKVKALILGLVIGVLLQFLTLGINCIIIIIYGNSSSTSSTDGNPSNNESATFNFNYYNTQKAIIFSLTSLLTSGISLWIVKFLRQLLTINSSFTTKQSSSVSLLCNDKDRLLDTLINSIENWFLAGVLFGVCSAWLLTDLILGLYINSLLTMIVVSYCGLFLLLFLFNDNEYDNYGYFLSRYFSFHGNDCDNYDQKEEAKTKSLSVDDNVMSEPSGTNNDLHPILIV